MVPGREPGVLVPSDGAAAVQFKIVGTRLYTALAILCLASSAVAADQKGDPKKDAGPLPATQSNPGGAGAQSAATAKGTENIDPTTYVIGAEDQLLIRVWREPELTGPVVVRPDGKITIQLLREVAAAGRTPEQLAQVIRDGLAEKYLKNPEVTVSVLAVNSKKFYIQGGVIKPGSFPLLVPTTVLEALVNAGGFREFANAKKIFVLRDNRRLPFNYRDVIKGKNLSQNILLENGDIIVVPE